MNIEKRFPHGAIGDLQNGRWYWFPNRGDGPDLQAIREGAPFLTLEQLQHIEEVEG